MFPKKFKEILLQETIKSVNSLLITFPDIRSRLDIPLDSFSIETNFESLTEYKKFVRENNSQIMEKYYQLLYPEMVISGNGGKAKDASAILIFFIEDFYLFSIYRCLDSADISVLFDELWEFFEREFFAKENNVELISRLKNFIYQSGGNAEDIIPWSDIELTWAKNTFDFRLLGWERKSSYLYSFLDNFQVPWIILKKKIIVRNRTELRTASQNAEDQFNLFTFVVRNVSGGGVYFNDLRIFGLGHLSPISEFNNGWHSVPDNDIYEEFGEQTTITHPWDWSISKLLGKCDANSYSEYLFADWLTRLNSNFIPKKHHNLPSLRREFYQYEKILNLSFVFNSLLPDLGNRDNKCLREAYLPTILEIAGGLDKIKSELVIKLIYDIRNDIAHGNSSSAEQKIRAIGSLDDVDEKIRFFSYIISKIILISLTNCDFKSKMEQYYRSGNTCTIPQLIRPFS